MAAGSESKITAHYEREDAVEHLYDVTIFDRTITTTVTEDPEMVKKWIKVIEEDDTNNSSRCFIGVEAEIYLDDKFKTHIGTFQMCDGIRCLVFQLVNCSKDDCPDTLKSFLEDERYGFFGIDIVDKMKMLGEIFSINPKIHQLLDLNEVAMERYKRPELKYAEQSVLVRLTLGEKVEKPEVDPTQWSYPGKLSHVQVHYACLGAFLNLQVGRWLNNNEI